MRTAVLRCVLVLVGACLLVVALPTVGKAEEPKSAALAKELGQILDQAKLDAIAAKDPSVPDGYVAALHFSGSQLLVVSARYAVPVILNERIAKKEYRDIYSDLNSACIAGSKTFIMDMGVDGLKAQKSDNRVDTWESGTKSVSFDGEWKKQKLASEDEYNKTFASADEHYAKMLSALIAQAKKTQ